MIKLINCSDQNIGSLLYDKHIPRVGDIIIREENAYKVLEVMFNDDENEIILRIEHIYRTSYGNPLLAGTVSGSDIAKVTLLALSGDKLGALKLYKEITKKPLKDCKKFIDDICD